MYYYISRETYVVRHLVSHFLKLEVRSEKRHQRFVHPLRKWGLLFVVYHLSLITSFSQSRFDSIQYVDEVIVTARYNHKEVIPSQTLGGAQLVSRSAHCVADAVRDF